ncbi:hypothetical protein HYH02_010201 [Chlamydomonas schloesseri]|uniref:Pherophorin domain-containing protein n=1 Tax=Chlamydomonas schloesseri TaxID=2026947 RepID=A0A835W4U0_9CHLO|nr:hypothetical protein HYH02_010201 [Chlamydomonas schloesseri]|eukprot:KAG2440622.1 hypothetical protein HYH02_010201 [Chlamydomonas schloesseri]
MDKGYELTKDFYCAQLNVSAPRPNNRPAMRVCGDFKLESEARSFGTYLSDGGGFRNDLAPAIGFGNYIVPVFGQRICLVSELSYIVTDRTGKICDQYTYSEGCKPPQDEFPYCTCKPGAMLSTPYNVTYTRKFASNGNNNYCFRVNVDTKRCVGRCCSMDLDKVEWMSNGMNCRYAVAGFTVSTKPNAFVAPVWSTETDNLITAPNPAQVAVLKTNNLNLDVRNANGVEICIALKANGKCPTMEDFCYDGLCKYAIFDRSAGCCANDFAEGNDFGYNRRR